MRRRTTDWLREGELGAWSLQLRNTNTPLHRPPPNNAAAVFATGGRDRSRETDGPTKDLRP